MFLRRVARPGWIAVITCVLLAPAGALHAAHAAQDSSTVTVDGTRLRQQATATRSMLFGAVDIYSVSLYAPRPLAGEQELRRPDMRKAVRVAVKYDGAMPQKVPSSWWEELVPALGPEQEDKLKAAFAALSPGDEVWATFAPGEGTRIRRNDEVVVHTSGHELMNAMLDLWLGQTPVSSEVQQALQQQLRRRR